ncbi:MAG: site-specific integrase [Candidatus Methanoperedens sp.]|nr:site-specific integrase [Candidatus Methanoperedens sp.]
MVKEDIHNTSRILENTSERFILKLNPEDQEDVRRFMDDLLARGFSPARVIKYLSSLVSISKRLDVSLKKVKSEDLKKFAAWLGKSDYAEWTKHGLKIILKKYMQRLGKEKEIDWLKIKQPKNGKLPEEVLTEEDIKALAGAAYTARDKVFVLALYESGCRIGEFLPLKLKHVCFDRFGAVFMVTGKTGPRRIRLVASTLILQAWLSEHPTKNDPDAYMWCKTPTQYNPKWKNNHLSYGFICRLLTELAVKAGVKKAVNPHSFRHSRATFMAQRLKEPEMREFFGWDSDSEMPSTYVHLSGRDIDNSVLSIYGYKDAAKSQEPLLQVKPCPRCQEPSDPASKFCKKCGMPLDERYNVDKLEGLVVDFLKIMGDTFPQVKDKFREVVRARGAESLFI